MEVSKLIIPSNGEQVTVNIKDATAREAIANLDGISPSDVADKDATLSWGTKTEIATIGELSIHVTLPSNPDTNAVTSVAGKTGVVTLNKSDVGLGNVDNTADANKSVLYADTAGAAPASDVYSWAKAENKPTYTKSEVGLGNVTNDAQVKRTEMGVANGVATLDDNGKVPSSQLAADLSNYINKVNVGNTEYIPSGGAVSLPAYPTTLPASDVYSWAKEENKPSYTLSEVGAAASVVSLTVDVNSTCSITGAGNEGKMETIVYINSSGSSKTVTIPTTYSTPDGSAIVLTVPDGGYCEVNYLNISGTIYARGL